MSYEIHVLHGHIDIVRIGGDTQTIRAALEHHVIESECSAVTICNEHPSSCSGVVGHNHRICDGHIPGAARGIGLNAIGMIAPLSGRFNVRIADGDIAATRDAYTFPCINPDMVEGERAGAADDRIAVG